MAPQWIFDAYSYFIDVIRKTYLNVIAAIIIIFIGVIIGKIAGKLIKKILNEVELNSIIKKSAGLDINLEKLMSSIASYLIYMIAIIMALNQIGITTTVLTIVLVIVLIVAAISILLAVKDFIPNLFAGIYLLKDNKIKVGERIRVNGVEGTVKEITLFETKIENDSEDILFLPNSTIMKSQVTKIRKKQSKKR